jgi:hypothetical protein
MITHRHGPHGKHSLLLSRMRVYWPVTYQGIYANNTGKTFCENGSIVACAYFWRCLEIGRHVTIYISLLPCLLHVLPMASCFYFPENAYYEAPNFPVSLDSFLALRTIDRFTGMRKMKVTSFPLLRVRRLCYVFRY